MLKSRKHRRDLQSLCRKGVDFYDSNLKSADVAHLRDGSRPCASVQRVLESLAERIAVSLRVMCRKQDLRET